MSLVIRSDTPETGTLTVHLEGRLDSETATDFDAGLGEFFGPEIRVLVFNLVQLEYLSSAGIRSLFTARMEMDSRNGCLLLLSPQPSVRKVLEMVRIVEAKSILADSAELDAFLHSL